MPTTIDLTAASVMDAAASLLNDTAKSTYTYTVQIPYLNMALRNLQMRYELNNMPVTDELSTVITVPAGSSSIGFEPSVPVPGTPYLPDDLIEPKLLWEREHNIDPYIPMTRVDTLDLTLSGVEINQFINYVWQSNQIRVLPANQINDIKMNYIRNLFNEVDDSTDPINVVNAQSYLQFRTAALVAKYVEENDTRFAALNGEATNSMDEALGIGTKGRQAINTRHKPFRAAYKSRGYF